MCVEGSRWTRFRDKVKHAVEKVWKEVRAALGIKVVGELIAGRKR
jgi:hypothetical protein